MSTENDNKKNGNLPISDVSKRICKNCRFMTKLTTYIPFESTENTCIHDDMLWTKDINSYACRYFDSK